MMNQLKKLMMNQLKKLWRDESGISAIEYALIASGIALAIVTVVGDLGEAVNDKFEEIILELDPTYEPPA